MHTDTQNELLRAPEQVEPHLSPIQRLRQRLRSRPDSEHEMTPNRMIFAGSVVTYLLVATWLGSEDAHAMLLGTASGFAIYFVVSLGIFAHIVWKPGASKARRLFAMVSDFTMISYAAAVGGIATGFFYPFYLWTIFGNGFRFGIPFLHAAMLVGNIGFISVIAATGIWRDHLGLSIALSLCLVMLPLYAGKLIKKLSEAKEQAEQANRAKGAFLASVSHELRTPLNAVIGLGDLLRNQIGDPEQRKMVRTIADAGRTLLNLINSILDFSRIEAGKMPIHISDVDFYPEMRRVESLLTVPAAAKSIAFNVHISARTPRRIRCDFGHIEQVLVNLCANAIKFTSSGHVVVTVDTVHADDERLRLRFEVADTGIGIAPSAQKQIFEAFAQADSTILDRFGGTGLGLAISKQLVMLMNGEVGLESELGKGSTFWFEIETTPLPCEPAALPDLPPIQVFTRDAELARAVRDLGFRPATVTAVGELLAAAHEDESGSPPIAIVDCAAIGAGQLDETLAALRGCGARVLLVGDTAGVSLADVFARRDSLTSLVRPVHPADLRNALELAALKSGSMTEDSLLAPQAPASRRSLSVLVAEDNGTNQMVIGKILERAGHRATIVNNGQEALDALREGAFDLVLMDVNMPVLNGIEATKLHRFATVGLPQVPIVALTADATADAVARCEEAGMNAYATKPIEPAKLIEIIDRVTSEVASADEAAQKRVPAEFAFSDESTESPIDSSKLEDLENLGGRHFVAELAFQFSQDSENLLRQLRTAAAKGDVSSFREALHALRSCAANVGATRVFQFCLTLRSRNDNELRNHGEDGLRPLEEEVQRALANLAAHIARDEKAKDDVAYLAAG